MKLSEKITVNDLLYVHQIAVEVHGGAHGILNEGTLHYLTEKASHYSDPILMSASLLHGIATMHPFIDGNKRTAFASADMALGIHGMRLFASNTAAVSFTLSIARGEKTEEQVKVWIEKNSGMSPTY